MLQLSINQGQMFININNWSVMPDTNNDPHNISIIGTVGKYTCCFQFVADNVSATYYLRKKKDIGNNFVILACEPTGSTIQLEYLECLQYLSYHETYTVNDWVHAQGYDALPEAATGVEERIECKEDNGRVSLPIYTFHLVFSTVAAYPAN